MKKTSLFLVISLIFVMVFATACSGGAKVPEEVSAPAQSAWEYYSWSENLGGDMWRGGGWHVQAADKDKKFSITKAMAGNVPDDLKVMMSMGMSSYTGKVWCLNFAPTLYFGYGPTVDETHPTKNFLMFEQSQDQWYELGSVWNEPWVNFLYPPNTYMVSMNFYMGVTKAMFESMGCTNWQE